jgi:hypothetical protein
MLDESYFEDAVAHVVAQRACRWALHYVSVAR